MIEFIALRGYFEKSPFLLPIQRSPGYWKYRVHKMQTSRNKQQEFEKYRPICILFFSYRSKKNGIYLYRHSSMLVHLHAYENHNLETSFKYWISIFVSTVRFVTLIVDLTLILPLTL